MSVLEKSKSRKKREGKSNKIVFDNEIITKDVAEKLAGEVYIKEFKKSVERETQNSAAVFDQNFIPKKKHKKRKDNHSQTIHNNSTKKEVNKLVNNEVINDSSVSEVEGKTETLDSNNSNLKKEESIRAKKRRRHLELLQEKKLCSEINLQQKCLNYLSKWKHNKSEWKFEKLKQVWLQQNVFDDTKVPDEFWNTLLEYFSSAKGIVKSNILSEAVKIVDSMQNTADEIPEETDMKYLRARDIVQNIQE